jgi:hypothetical protein
VQASQVHAGCWQIKSAKYCYLKLMCHALLHHSGAEGNELLKRVFQNYCKYTVGQV